MSHFEELKVWQKAVDIAISTYKITNMESFEKSDFGLKDQMRRASVNIASNIAEGDQLESDKSSIKHFRIAKGSTAELFAQLVISERIGYLSGEISIDIRKECKEILSMLTKLIQYRRGGEADGGKAEGRRKE
jgi:four helix bundle protein